VAKARIRVVAKARIRVVAKARIRVVAKARIRVVAKARLRHDGGCPAWLRRLCQSATKSIGASSTGGKPPSRDTSARILRAKGNSSRGHSTSSTGSRCSCGTLMVKTPQ